MVGFGNTTGGAAGAAYGAYKPPKELLDEYTVTIDLQLAEGAPPLGREGLSLFQTALVHAEESRSGRRRAAQSDGECVVNAAGGVGLFGSFGDTARVKLSRGRWHRVVAAVKCAKNKGDGGEGKAKKGELHTYIDAKPPRRADRTRSRRAGGSRSTATGCTSSRRARPR